MFSQEITYWTSEITIVCEEHWPADYPKVVYYGKEHSRDPPSVFLCVKKGLIPTKASSDKTTLKANPSSRNSQPDESNHFNKLDQITSFYDLILMLVNQERICTGGMHIIVNEIHKILHIKKFVTELVLLSLF